MRFGTRHLVACALLAAMALPASALAAPGALDRSFGTRGVVLTRVGSEPGSFLNALVAGPKRKVVAGGQTMRRGRFILALTRYLSNGHLDPGFGSHGKAFTDVSGHSSTVRDMVRLSNGRLVALGQYVGNDQGPKGSVSGFVLQRYLPSGRIDTSFGKRGRVTRGFSFPGAPVALVRKHDNRLIVLFAPQRFSTEGRTIGAGILLMRFRANGTLDRSFGGDGIVQTTRIRMTAGALVLQPDGKIVVAGSSQRDAPQDGILLARYLPSGRLDTTFGTGGLTTASLGLIFSSAGAVKTTPAGDLMVAGTASPSTGDNGRLIVADFRATGAPRTTFGTGGVAQVDLAPGFDGFAALVRQPNGRLVLAGTASSGVFPPAPTNFALARLLPGGSLDTGFGTGGVAVYARVTSGENALRDLVRQPDGRLVAGGVAGRFASSGDMAADARFALIRVLG